MLASCDHQKSKLCAVAGAEGFWSAELRVRQLKIGSKSCFGLHARFASIPSQFHYSNYGLSTCWILVSYLILTRTRVASNKGVLIEWGKS